MLCVIVAKFEDFSFPDLSRQADWDLTASFTWWFYDTGQFLSSSLGARASQFRIDFLPAQRRSVIFARPANFYFLFLSSRQADWDLTASFALWSCNEGQIFFLLFRQAEWDFTASFTWWFYHTGQLLTSSLGVRASQFRIDFLPAQCRSVIFARRANFYFLFPELKASRLRYYCELYLVVLRRGPKFCLLFSRKPIEI